MKTAQDGQESGRGMELVLAAALEPGDELNSLAGRTVGDPKVRALLERADAAVRARKPGEALILYQQTLKLDPKSAEATWGIARVWMTRGKLDQGAAYSRRALALDPRFGKPYFTLGNIARRQRKPGDAIRLFSKCAELEPTWIYSYLNIGHLYATLKRWADAETWYRKGLGQDSENARLLTNIGFLFFTRTDGKRDPEQARGFYEHALKTEPRFLLARHHLAGYYMDAGQPGKAREEFTEAVKVNPADAPALNGIGRTYFREGDYAKAAAAYRRAVAADPTDPVYAVNLASALLKTGNRAAATAAAKRALAAGFRPDWARRVYDQLGLK